MLNETSYKSAIASEVGIPVGSVTLTGDLIVPAGARGVILFAHGSDSSRHSPRNQFVARAIREFGFGTLLFDLLTLREEEEERWTRHLRFNVALLAQRLMAATNWIMSNRRTAHLPLGYFGSSTGAAAALVAAADMGTQIGAVVSRSGRPDLADSSLADVRSPTLFIVGEFDQQVIDLHYDPLAHLQSKKRLAIVPGATHLFEEPGTLEQVALISANWFQEHLVEGREVHAEARSESRVFV